MSSGIESLFLLLPLYRLSPLAYTWAHLNKVQGDLKPYLGSVLDPEQMSQRRGLKLSIQNSM